jgi:DNA-binding NarL/FixJ family response regulator
MPFLKTFIVEDSPLICENLIATLEDLVAIKVVGTAADEASALSWLCQPDHQIDLVIVDIFLKGGSGLGVLRAANHNNGHLNGNSDQPRAGGTFLAATRRNFVVLSNYATPEMRRKCLELGADRVFDKSTEIEALMAYCGHLAAGDMASTGPGALQ